MTDQNPVPTTRMPLPEPSEPAALPPVEPPVEPLPPAVDPRPPVAPVAPFEARSRRDDRDHGRTASILFGLVILGLGLWFFAEHTLGYELPRIRWSQLWPVFLIGIGLWIVLGTMRRGSR